MPLLNRDRKFSKQDIKLLGRKIKNDPNNQTYKFQLTSLKRELKNQLDTIN